MRSVLNVLQDTAMWWEAIRMSKDPADFMGLFEDGAAVLGIMVVFVLLWVVERTKNPYLDGVASLLVGCLLTFTSAVLARESRSLLIGEGVSENCQDWWNQGEDQGPVSEDRLCGKG
ncbi:cation transporter [Puia sp. P3]|uniref:cation transporter n=1 Tax=Puia sp. P3 TaxID=3423952 RepID=UPI003D664485